MPACAQPIKAKLESFMVDDMKYCGLLNETDPTQVQQRIIASGTLTVDEMNTFFLKKNEPEGREKKGKARRWFVDGSKTRRR